MDLLKEITNYLYEQNVRADIKIEELAQDLYSIYDEYEEWRNHLLSCKRE